MNRSVSLNRLSDDYSKIVTTSQSPGQRSSSTYDVNTLPRCDPISEMAKEFARDRFSENAAHVIPFVIFVCVIILWFFSNPGAHIERLNLEGEIESDSDGTQTGVLPTMNSGDISTEELGAKKVSSKPKTFW